LWPGSDTPGKDERPAEDSRFDGAFVAPLLPADRSFLACPLALERSCGYHYSNNTALSTLCARRIGRARHAFKQ
jgi:hypothetical protein